MVEERNVGMVEKWKDGITECGNIGRMEGTREPVLLFHYSNILQLLHSIFPKHLNGET